MRHIIELNDLFRLSGFSSTPMVRPRQEASAIAPPSIIQNYSSLLLLIEIELQSSPYRTGIKKSRKSYCLPYFWESLFVLRDKNAANGFISTCRSRAVLQIRPFLLSVPPASRPALLCQPAGIQVPPWRTFIGRGLFFHQQYRTMLTRNQSKGTKTICHIREPSRPSEYVAPELDEEEVVTFQTHSQKMDLNKQDENDLFEKVLGFLKEFLSSRKLWAEVQERMNKYAKSSERLTSEKKNEKMLSFKKMTFGSRICFDAEAVPKGEASREHCEARATRGNNKKISILINEEDFSSSSSEEMFSDDILSETVVRTIRSIEIPRLEMSLETVELIYDTPQPFLITLSLCIFTRYCLSTRRRVRLEESAWVLCVATVIAYKLYYDQEIEGLIDCFTGIMKVQKQDLIDLERCFLEEIDYATVIRNYDYHFIMAKLLSVPVQQRIEEEQ